MPANSKAIKLDVNGKPAPQYYNPTTDAYEYLQGEAGAARSILWGPDGLPVSVVGSKLAVRASELEDRLGATTDAAQTNPAQAASQIALLKGLLTKLQDPATQTTLAQAKTVLDAINTNTDTLEALLTAIRDTAGIKKITDPVDVADRAARLLGKVGADDGALATLGALADAAKTDPAQAASVIALLKGLLQTLRTDSAKVQLTGSSATPATTLANGVTGSGSSAWVACAGHGRALVLVRGSADFRGWVRLRGRADTDVSVLPMYYMNTGIAFERTGIVGYYEADINPFSEAQVEYVVSAGTLTVKAWFSAVTFVPDTCGAALPLFNALAIRDTNDHWSPVFSATGMRRARLYVDNTLNVSVNLILFDDSTGYRLRNAAGADYILAIPQNVTGRVYEPSDWPILGGILPNAINMRATAAGVPTSGSLTVKLLAEAM